MNKIFFLALGISNLINESKTASLETSLYNIFNQKVLGESAQEIKFKKALDLIQNKYAEEASKKNSNIYMGTAFYIVFSAQIGLPCALNCCITCLREALCDTEDERSIKKCITLLESPDQRLTIKKDAGIFYGLIAAVENFINNIYGLPFTYEEITHIEQAYHIALSAKKDDIKTCEKNEINQKENLDQANANISYKQNPPKRNRSTIRGYPKNKSAVSSKRLRTSDEDSSNSGKKSTDSSSRPSKRKRRA